MSKQPDTYLSDEELETLNAEIEAQEEDVAPIGAAQITDELIKKAAALSVGDNLSKTQVRQKLGVTGYLINKIYKHELFKSTIAAIVDDAVLAAKNKTRQDISRMQNKAMVALEKNLDKHSLEAVKVYLRAIGMEHEPEANKDAGGFTLVLANQKPDPQTVQVVKEDE